MADLQQAALAAAPPVSPDPGWSPARKAVAGTYNRLGGLMQKMAALINVPLPPTLGVFYVESGGKGLTPGQAIIRFEVHHFWAEWGAANVANFDAHFQFGGHNGVPGKTWEGHAFRVATSGPFSPVHTGAQSAEYAAFGLATQLGGMEAAARCISMGGCQIMGSAFGMLGYGNATAMFNAFQANENAHVLGFFDFCAHQPAPRPGSLLTYLQHGDFSSFARFYNGAGQVGVYARRLQDAAANAAAVIAGG